jgi:hypothetical protein
MSSTGDSGQAPSSVVDEQFYYAVQPNSMTYTDDTTGVSRSIHIPKGRFVEACEHMVNENWEALSLFPTWSMYAMLRSCRDCIMSRTALTGQFSWRTRATV